MREQMTKEELKQEAEEWLCNNLHSASEEDFIKAMVDIAEPREKRIAELEKELKDANEKVVHLACNQNKDLKKENAELKEELKTAYRKGMRHMAKALKDYDRTDGAWTDYFEHTVDKVLQREQLEFEEYGTLADQLTKAKEIILRLYNAGRDVLMCRAEEKAYDNLSNAINDKSIEQFLKEVEK